MCWALHMRKNNVFIRKIKAQKGLNRSMNNIITECKNLNYEKYDDFPLFTQKGVMHYIFHHLCLYKFVKMKITAHSFPSCLWYN